MTKYCVCGREIPDIVGQAAMTDQTGADDVARERATQYVQKACQWLPPMTGEQQDRLLNEIAAALQAERARTIEACCKAECIYCRAGYELKDIDAWEDGRFVHLVPSEAGHGVTYSRCEAIAIRAMASAGTAGDACCDNEDRTMDGGCRNCGDPSF